MITSGWFGLGVSLDQQELVKNITNPHLVGMINEFYNFRVCLIRANSRVCRPDHVIVQPYTNINKAPILPFLQSLATVVLLFKDCLG